MPKPAIPTYRAMPNVYTLADKLAAGAIFTEKEWMELLDRRRDSVLAAYTAQKAQTLAIRYYGRRVFLRGLIEFTNICRNDCYYCGIRAGNKGLQRFRLTNDEILATCAYGWELGFRTFVLQGGEDPYWTDERLTALVAEIHATYPEAAITLSVGERPRESYAALYQAGARRYLLRHETADEVHYRQLHPEIMSLAHRLACLQNLKAIGFQTGAGLMVGSPGQGTASLVKDMLLLQHLAPEMVGIGPFLPHHETPFCLASPGRVDETLFLLSLVRLLLPTVLLPATTALGTADQEGQVAGILAGANVIMPNLSPPEVRGKYQLYDGKRHSGTEAAEGLADIRHRLAAIGYEASMERGDHVAFTKTGGFANDNGNTNNI